MIHIERKTTTILNVKNGMCQETARFEATVPENTLHLWYIAAAKIGLKDPIVFEFSGEEYYIPGEYIDEGVLPKTVEVPRGHIRVGVNRIGKVKLSEDGPTCQPYDLSRARESVPYDGEIYLWDFEVHLNALEASRY